MDKLKNLVVPAVVSALVAVLLGSFVIQGQAGPQGPAGKPSLGGTSPDIISPYLRFGDVAVYAQRTTALNVGSTTICSLQAPAATSTLRGAAVDLSYSSTSASTLTIARATTIAASTTPLITSGSISANAKTSLYASSTGQGSDVWAPNTWLNVTMKGGSNGTFSPTGACQATWEVIGS